MAYTEEKKQNETNQSKIDSNGEQGEKAQQLDETSTADSQARGQRGRG